MKRWTIAYLVDKRGIKYENIDAATVDTAIKKFTRNFTKTSPYETPHILHVSIITAEWVDVLERRANFCRRVAEETAFLADFFGDGKAKEIIADANLLAEAMKIHSENEAKAVPRE